MKPLPPPTVTNKGRFELVEDLMPRLLASAPGKSVFDIGAGNGEMRDVVERHGGVWKGFDLSPKRPDIARWNLEEAPAGFEREAHVILLMEVLEHLDNPWLSMRNLTRTLQQDGLLVLTTPNPHWSRARFQFLNRGGICSFEQSDLEDNHHVFTPWLHIVRHLLEDLGYDIEGYYNLDGRMAFPPPPPIRLNYPIRMVQSLLCRWIEHRDPRAVGWHYTLVARLKRIEPAVSTSQVG